MPGITALPKEVLVLIGDRLDNRALMASLTTCRIIHQSLSHLLWRIIRIKQGEPQVNFDNLTAHANFVHHYEIHGVVPWDYYGISFPGLFSLAIHRKALINTVQDAALMAQQDQYCITFFQLNPSVQDLTLYSMGNYPCEEFWKAIFTSFRRPRCLRVNRLWALDGRRLDCFWRACSRFEDISLSEMSSHSPSILSELSFESVKRLSMDWSFRLPYIQYPALLDIIRTFHNLTRLHWKTYRGEFPIEALTKALEDKTWPHLEDLRMAGSVGKDDGLRQIIEKLPPLRRAQIDVMMFGPSCWSNFRNKQGGSLRALDLRECRAFDNRWALDAFAFLEHLEEFTTPFIEIAHIKEYPNRWRCLGLKTLHAFFIRDPENADEDQVAFEFLSNFKRLESIDVSNTCLWEGRLFSVEEAANLRHPHTLRWRFDKGLEKLRGLENLRRLVLDNRFQEARVHDVQRMVEHWPFLAELTGILSADLGIREDMAVMFKNLGIDNWDFVDLCNSISK
ncbi:hypothetical protein BGZ95_009723 [Linnemannia exigua]|uniref:F-box domain-containing protein n=1 Tax=Linnemannia exigua TaxID=604196 RepID=A0AAD4H6E6_9FUNG|nr:hypothetical protein BGZ95_009723 [Linnemannia exigua]